MPFKIEMTINKFPMFLFVLIGSITIYHVSEQRHFVENAEYTVGVVIDISVEEHARGESHFPIIEFVAQNEKIHTFKSNIVNQGYSVGDEIGVRYFEDDIRNAVISHYDAVWSRAYILIFLTLVCFVTGLGITFRRK